MIVTKEDVHDGKMLKELVDDISKNYNIKKHWLTGEHMILKTTSGILTN